MRYQGASEIRTDLKRLRRDTDSGRSASVASAARAGLAAPPPFGQEGSALPQPDAPKQASSGAQSARITSSGPRSEAGEGIVSAPRSRRWVIPAAAVLLLIAAVGAFLHFRRTPALTERDLIVVADFVNTTGESVFDGTLKEALTVQLGQSPYLNILPETRLRQALRLMGRSSDERITNDVAREICVRQGRAYALQGDKDKARIAYQDFFAVWKDADPDIPILKEAKAEYEKIK